ncbi:hypothetical protein NtRootA4_37020 [Arthrobacter sp. NtRootA4]|uniref:NUDIX hydrolase n=1 Tax=Paenarthrobacter nicotinovorans TaxID=29320 RepID=UPI001E7C143B|nr:hypothetical protein NtRootA2_39230 [Arthrobacter sp. NtRootA2]BCW16723.1 hypothetical protein NtRootA4_37020 [Arthrobacter sp. NtRootA4]BCW25056.1 hypothetical protein NtRootC7_39230 [Arthrobacter sp. NtRootC7]BCW29325.1 hypothetical protein NtRootC45_39250 [Arthrobacter sp. NtRootC45]BCW33596.1 hypothetical protein NtRootD5_39270 [Arthrobacter sp. NtRootD5]
MPDPETWSKTGAARAYNGFVKIDRATFQEPGGTISEWDIITGPDSAAVLAFTPEASHVVLFEQFRVGPERSLLELPGGYLSPNESPETAATRELLEETGYQAGSTYYAGAEWWAANSTRRKHISIAADASPTSNPSWDVSEMGNIQLLPSQELLHFLLSGNLTDAGLACRALLSFTQARQSDPELKELQDALRTLLTY